MSAVPSDPVPAADPPADPVPNPMSTPPRAASAASTPARVGSAGDAVTPNGIPLPRDMRSGPIVAGVDDAIACGRPLRAAAFLALATGKPLLLVHVRRRAMPMVEGYVPIPEEIGANDEAENEVESELVARADVLRRPDRGDLGTGVDHR